MVFRAKVTNMVEFVTQANGTKGCYLVYDKKDTYVEVKDEDFADFIEEVNNLLGEITKEKE